MPKGKEIEIKISGKVDPSFNTSVNVASKRLNSMNGNAKNVSKSFGNAGKAGQKFGQQSSTAVQSLDQVLAAAGIVAALNSTYDAFYECIEVAEKYETALAKIATIADTSVKSMGVIKDEITSLSAETGQSVTDLSESTYQAISASVDTADSVDFVRKSNMLAVGGFTETTSAVNVLTTALNAYGLGADKTSSISDMLIQTQNKGKTTVDELANSLGAVIPTAAAYNVNMQNVATSYAQLTKNGIATQNAGTYIKGMLNELAKDGSTVSTVLKEKTGMSFAMLTERGKSLGDVLGILGDSVGGNATEFSNLWSNTRAASGALSIYNSGAEAFNDTLSDMENSAGLTAKAYSTMTNTGEHAAQVFNNAGELFKISVGEQLAPGMETLYELGTAGLEMLTEFTSANPAVVQALAAGTIGVTVFAGGLALYTVGSRAATIATAAFNAVLDANPIFFAVTAIAALTAGVAVFIGMQNNASKAAEQLTYSAEKQSDKLDKLNKEHEKAVETYGKESTQAEKVQKKINALNKEISNSTQSYGDLIRKNEELARSYKELQDNDDIEKINNQSKASAELVNRLYDLQGQTNLTASEQAEMSAIIEELNQKFPELGLTVENLGNKAVTTKEALLNMLEQDYNQKKYDEAHEQFMQAKSDLEQETELWKELSKEVKEASDEYMASDGNAQAYNKYLDFWNQMRETLDSEGNTVKKTFREIYEESKNRFKGLTNDVENYSNEMAKLKGFTDSNSKSQKSWQQVTALALQSNQSKIEDLAKAYDTAYQSAYKSISGTVGQFKKLSNKSDLTVSEMQSAWQNQSEWVNKYTDNLKKASKYGLTKGLVKSLSDGSEKSGQYINKIITKLDGMNSVDASQFVKNLNKNYTDVQKAEKGFSDTVAKYSTDYDKKLSKIEKSTKKTVKSMNLKKDAEKSALSTISAYFDSLVPTAGMKKTAAQRVQSAVSSILTPQGISPKTTKVEQNAKGTKHSANVFLAGEQGPELVVNAEGSQVFTAAETQRILGGDADESKEDSAYNYSFDIPELYKQLMDNLNTTVKGQSLENAVQNFDNVTNNNDSSSIVFSPNITVTVSGGKNSDIEQGVQKAVKISLQDFEKMMKQYDRRIERKKFKR